MPGSGSREQGAGKSGSREKNTSGPKGTGNGAAFLNRYILFQAKTINGIIALL
jgi:hypothetical protein